MSKKLDKNYFIRSTMNKENNFNFFPDKFRGQMNCTNFPQHFFSIVAIFAQDSNYNIRKLDTMNGNLFISGFYKGEKNELMLRYTKENDLIVARVQFIHQRKGNMTNLFEILKKIKRRYKLNRIIIESVQSESMEEWCKKNKFKKMIYCFDSYEYS